MCVDFERVDFTTNEDAVNEEFCGYDGVPREISKLHPPSLVKSLDEQMEDDLYGLINEILFLQ